ncbi:MAG: glycosyltransferase [Chitinophagaceae bacterium]
MKIVIDSRNTYNNDRGLRVFTYELWQQLAFSQPGHVFVFITGQKNMPARASANVHTRYLRKTGFGWYDKIRLKKILLQLQADALVAVQDGGFSVSHHLQDQKDKKGSVPLAKKVLFAGAASPASTTEPVQTTITIQPALAEVITLLTWAEAESIKTQYTGGRAYFLFTGNISDQQQLIELLKAFSIFKKWQQSGMQLVIAGYTTSWTEVLEEKLLQYKYKADIVLLKNISHAETAKLVAACYALVYPVAGNVFPLALLWAIQANKAIIATDNEINRQITSTAAWVEKANTAAGFAKAMILLYKDENQQQLLVQQTKEEAQQITRDQMLAAVWRCIAQ